ncbi:DUF3040 domain-containing protein [Streptomyces sp. NPDC059008]|uniref:DUF3040 domain-containing protein n=1 Tax=Streptomyces sp. NPDC059008 TaxID=3346693 RepID=UPI0036ADD812
MSNPSKKDRRILAEMERHLALDDPELASRLDALNCQFPVEDEVDDRAPAPPRDVPGADDSRAAEDNRADGNRMTRDWRWTAAVVLGVLALIGLILVGIFTRPPPGEDKQGTPRGSSPAVAVLIRSRTRFPAPAGESRTPLADRTPGGRMPCAHVISQSRTSRSAATPTP